VALGVEGASSARAGRAHEGHVQSRTRSEHPCLAAGARDGYEEGREGAGETVVGEAGLVGEGLEGADEAMNYGLRVEKKGS
jgi:hypothetical protein